MKSILSFLLLCAVFNVWSEITSNQLNVQTQFLSIESPTVAEAFIIDSLASLDLKHLQHALNQISGEQYTSLAVSDEITAYKFLRSLYTPLRLTIVKEPCPSACCSELPKGALWIQGGGGQNFINNCKHANNTLSNGYLLSAGAHVIYDCDWTLGLAAGYGKDFLDYRHDGRAKNRHGFAAIYGVYRPLGYYVYANLAYGRGQNTLTRRIQINDFTLKSFSTPKSNIILGSVEAGMDCPLWDLLVQPFFAIEGDGAFRRGLSEIGSFPLNLNVSRHRYGNVYSRLGAHITMDCCCFLASLDLVWKYRLNPANHKIKLRFHSFGKEFYVKDVKRGQSFFESAFTVLTPVCVGLSVYVEVSGFVGYHSAAYQGLAGIDIKL